MENKDVRIVFMGSPEFAVPSLCALIENGYTIVAVVTTPDKPAGRGLKVKQSEVKRSVLKKGLLILQPVNLKDPEFQKKIVDLKPDLQIIVGFRKLPEEIMSIPKYGTFNLHASFLPNYRGAAPINWAIINGEKETGVTTFFINEVIDAGKIIFRERVAIGEDENAGELHDKLAKTGAELVLKTTRAIVEKKVRETDQDELLKSMAGELKRAPKIHKEDCAIDWNRTPKSIYNLIRGLSPYPAAWTMLQFPAERKLVLKIFTSTPEFIEHDQHPGTLVSDQKTYLKVAVPGGYIHLLELQLEGKKRIKISDFLRGKQVEGCRVE